uniref:Prolyl endopeptidase n=1 Tax=Kalanchoe fedtschenkoi TaxID=63787 RepID=A0A7N0ZZL7_KALFE
MACIFLLNPRWTATRNPSFNLAFLRLISSASFSALCQKKPLFNLPSETPPIPKKVPFQVAAHGRQWKDPYHWMSNIQDPDFTEYVNRENSYAEAFMADTRSLREKLVGEMTRRMPPKTETPPQHWGPWVYYQFIPEEKEYPILCRRLDSKKKGWLKSLSDFLTGRDKDIVLLDWNELAEKHGYIHVGTCRVSPDHKFLAYTLDTRGNERFALIVKDLRDGSILSASGVDGVVSLAWVQDGGNLYLYYTLSDASQRPYRVLRKKIGSDALGDDDNVYTEIDSSFCVDITNTKDGRFVTVNSNSRTSSEVYVIDTSKPEDGLRRVHKRIPNVQYFLEHHCGYFYVLTNAPVHGNLSREDYYLAISKVEDAESATWQNIVLPSEDTSIHDMDISNGHLVLFLRKGDLAGICSIEIPIDLSSKPREMEMDWLHPWYFPIPADMCTVVPGSNNDFMSTVYRVVISSPVMPDVVVDYDMSTKEFHIVQQDEVMGVSENTGSCTPDSYTISHIDSKISEERYNQNISEHQWRNFSSAYSCEKLEVASHDGVRVPLTILYSKHAWKRGHSPGLLYGYGAYGEDLDQSWSGDRLSLLDRGWMLAFADVRGGGGDDPSWHKSGSGLLKLNSIYDFVACGEYLVNENFVHSKQLSAIGHSAGALLVASAINKRPELFGAAILKVPFLDICNTLLDPSLPLTILDYEEFGNPQIKSEFESILSYSPYENIPRGICPPPTLVIASFHDSRVGVWEAAKWVAKVREVTCPSCSRSVILRVSMIGGHFSEGGRFAHCHETAYEYAFLLKAVGASEQTVPEC